MPYIVAMTQFDVICNKDTITELDDGIHFFVNNTLTIDETVLLNHWLTKTLRKSFYLTDSYQMLMNVDATVEHKNIDILDKFHCHYCKNLPLDVIPLEYNRTRGVLLANNLYAVTKQTLGFERLKINELACLITTMKLHIQDINNNTNKIEGFSNDLVMKTGLLEKLRVKQHSNQLIKIEIKFPALVGKTFVFEGMEELKDVFDKLQNIFNRG